MTLKTKPETAAATLSLRERCKAYAQGRTDPLHEARLRLERIAQENSHKHWFVQVNTDQVLQQAQASARRWRAGRERGLFDGAFFGVKDNLVCRQLATHAGAPVALELGEASSPFIARLLRSGMILLGKLNMDEAAFGVSTQNPWWGECLNPLDASRSPGGSSGGSAAAVACGLADACLGTDTMGSVRIPAAYCALWGFKPSWRDRSLRGVVPLCASLDTVGPMAARLQDLIAVFELIERAPVPRVAPRALRIGLVQGSSAFVLDATHQQALATLRSRLSARGHSVMQMALPTWEPEQDRKHALLLTTAGGAKVWSGLPHAPLQALSEPTRRAFERGAATDPVRQRLAAQRMTALRRASRRWFESVDVLLMPVTPTIAPLKTAPIDPQIAQVCALANLTACPALAFPLADSESVLPSSFQLMGPRGGDANLLGIAAMLQRQGILPQ